MKVKWFLLFILLLTYSKVGAQIFTTAIDETALQFRVKQIDEFFERFNYQVNYKNEKIKAPFNREDRRNNFLTLLNLDKYSNGGKKLDSLAQRFVDYIIDKDIKISYEDTIWNAEAIGSFTYEKKKYDLKLILNTELIEKFIYKWVVSDIKSSLFDNFPEKPKGTLIIPPSEHGISFISLPEMFNLNKTAIACSYKKGYIRDKLVVFDYLMAVGKIRINPLKKVIFHFTFEKYDFDVERIEKENVYNQGWLINKIYEK